MRFAVVRGHFAAVQRPMQWCETDLHDCKSVLQHYGSREQSKLACFAEMKKRVRRKGCRLRPHRKRSLILEPASHLDAFCTYPSRHNSINPDRHASKPHHFHIHLLSIFFQIKMPFQKFSVLLQLFLVSVSVVGTWCESVRTMQVGHMFNLMDFYRK